MLVILLLESAVQAEAAGLLLPVVRELQVRVMLAALELRLEAVVVVERVLLVLRLQETPVGLAVLAWHHPLQARLLPMQGAVEPEEQLTLLLQQVELAAVALVVLG